MVILEMKTRANVRFDSITKTLKGKIAIKHFGHLFEIQHHFLVIASDKNIGCTICLSEISAEPLRTPCDHTFCKAVR